MRRSLLAAVICALLALPAWALACPVCFSAKEENRQAFVDTTIFMTLLPLALIGGIVWWLVRLSREGDAPDGLPPDHPSDPR